MADKDGKQLLHLVFGGELKSLGSTEFRDLDALDIVGIYPDYKSAELAWKAKAQASVDNAHMRYFVVHLHRLLEPDAKATGQELMEQSRVASRAARPATKKKRAKSAPKAFWRRIREPLAKSRFAKGAIASLFAGTLRFIKLTNPYAEGSFELAGGSYVDSEPLIVGLWHGQHLLAPALYPSDRGLVAMVSRSADAELNALVVNKFGIEAVRGSGGRNTKSKLEKGGATALIALKKALDAGKNVCMIADIPHGKPRDAGMGIVLLARLSGRPIAPAAIATSRRKVLESSWDKTTINLPFGRCAVFVAPLIEVAADADDAEMELKRQELTAAINHATEQAYLMVDGKR